MPAPVARRVCLPFHLARHTDKEDGEVDKLRAAEEEGPHAVTYIYLHLVGFGTRYVWLHVSTSARADGAASGFGACTMAMPTALRSRDEMRLASTQLLHAHNTTTASCTSGSSGRPVDGLEANIAMQEAFATHLAEQLTRRLQREAQEKAVSVTVNCAIEGTQAELLLGTASGMASPCTVAFGHCVMHHALRLVRDYLASAAAAGAKALC